MNQDQVKERLLLLDPDTEGFTVTFTGKASRKVDGLYYPDRREILLHNKNFSDDNHLLYTAIHEFAHHVHYTRSTVPVSKRAHTNTFWSIFHRLLFLAEEKGIYSNVFRSDERFVVLTKQIKDEYLSVNGGLMKELGGLLFKAEELCREHNASFEDYVDRELLLHRSSARLLMKFKEMDIDPAIGYENMKTVAGIREESFRTDAVQAFEMGKSPDMVRAEFAVRAKSDEALGSLFQERDRIERSIGTLTKKLARIERRIDELKSVGVKE
ncbi:MAG: hypothetical protein E4G96_05755 [Chrysiogenales bacterium]|nr:MAG: hypothetical protein E4G96_05755 [Chrysiogenales bacterium]